MRDKITSNIKRLFPDKPVAEPPQQRQQSTNLLQQRSSTTNVPKESSQQESETKQQNTKPTQQQSVESPRQEKQPIKKSTKKLQPRRETDFHKAWREARDMGLDTFNWRGKLYTTQGVTDTGEAESIDKWKKYLANRKQRQLLSFPIPNVNE